MPTSRIAPSASVSNSAVLPSYGIQRILARFGSKVSPLMYGPYHEVVSLGRACQTSYQLRRCLGVERAHVFDWVVTNDAGLLRHIENRLQGYFALNGLRRNGVGEVRDTVTDTLFLHEFPDGVDLATAHAQEAPRIAALVDRWHLLLRSDQSVLFVRQHAWSDEPLLCANRLQTALRALAPWLRFRLLYLTEPKLFEPAPDSDVLIHRSLALPDPPAPDWSDWSGLDAPWQEILAEALELPSPPVAGPAPPAAIRSVTPGSP